MDMAQLRNVVAFSILMGGQQVLTKAPDYLVEKYRRIVGDPALVSRDASAPLDLANQSILDYYFEIWKPVLDGR